MLPAINKLLVLEDKNYHNWSPSPRHSPQAASPFQTEDKFNEFPKIKDKFKPIEIFQGFCQDKRKTRSPHKWN